MVRCAVWGSPITHSLSPVLHRAAYATLGLTDWTYTSRDVDAASFVGAVADLDDSWRGLSLTMPLKEVAASVATTVSATARETGAINTLVREARGWAGHNTDVQGIRAALAEAGCARPRTATIIGSGATARSVVRALEVGGAEAVSFMVRADARPQTLAQAERAGLSVEVVPLGAWPRSDVVVSTVPPAAVTGLDGLPSPDSRHGVGAVLDVVYGGGETPLQLAARARGWSIIDGTAMLLHQAAEQVHLMTGREAPLEAMRSALAAARPSAASR